MIDHRELARCSRSSAPVNPSTLVPKNAMLASFSLKPARLARNLSERRRGQAKREKFCSQNFFERVRCVETLPKPSLQDPLLRQTKRAVKCALARAALLPERSEGRCKARLSSVPKRTYTKPFQAVPTKSRTLTSELAGERILRPGTEKIPKNFVSKKSMP